MNSEARSIDFASFFTDFNPACRNTLHDKFNHPAYNLWQESLEGTIPVFPPKLA